VKVLRGIEARPCSASGYPDRTCRHEHGEWVALVARHRFRCVIAREMGILIVDNNCLWKLTDREARARPSRNMRPADLDPTPTEVNIYGAIATGGPGKRELLLRTENRVCNGLLNEDGSVHSGAVDRAVEANEPRHSEPCDPENARVHSRGMIGNIAR
jgi:hypothetical protein